MSAIPVRPEERSPFAPSRNGMPQHDVGRYHEGMMGISGETKKRKRRANFPQRTTDELRSWFLGNLQHPYPTDTEKQDMARVTGLQMNQITNWFINARRRKLPTHDQQRSCRK
ncbi:Homeodomain-related protein [Akanthomyces lecanii RCEF 1005]|uniref:Homeodomain-related protein n=1 Tax=Akanthomyces lecanii RCEF 1005 TaxID=1081108 RepID=A0A167XKV0_CORDF|nr:Homeodomain-related protein [Akanthomyces lecanii RCEF 1005]